MIRNVFNKLHNNLSHKSMNITSLTNTLYNKMSKDKAELPNFWIKKQTNKPSYKNPNLANKCIKRSKRLPQLASSSTHDKLNQTKQPNNHQFIKIGQNLQINESGNTYPSDFLYSSIDTNPFHNSAFYTTNIALSHDFTKVSNHYLSEGEGPEFCNPEELDNSYIYQLRNLFRINGDAFLSPAPRMTLSQDFNFSADFTNHKIRTIRYNHNLIINSYFDESKGIATFSDIQYPKFVDKNKYPRLIPNDFKLVNTVNAFPIKKGVPELPIVKHSQNRHSKTKTLQMKILSTTNYNTSNNSDNLDLWKDLSLSAKPDYNIDSLEFLSDITEYAFSEITNPNPPNDFNTPQLHPFEQITKDLSQISLLSKVENSKNEIYKSVLDDHSFASEIPDTFSNIPRDTTHKDEAQDETETEYIIFDPKLFTVESQYSEDNKETRNPFKQIHDCKQVSTVNFNGQECNYYGFLISNSDVNRMYKSYFDNYSSAAQDLEKRWTIFLKNDPEMSNSKNLKKLIRKGIPKCYRPKVWNHCLGSNILLEEKPNLFKRLVETPLEASEASNQIELDLARTFPNNIAFQSSAGLDSLRRVLHAFAIYKPQIGYCQALNYLAGTLLLIYTEEIAFWSLIQLIDSEIPGKGMKISGYYCKGMNLLLKDLQILSIIVQKRIPSVYKVLNYYQIRFEWICADWLLCLFSTQLPMESVYRVWDLIINEGSKILFRVSLALFYTLKKDLTNCKNMEDVMYLLRKNSHNLVQHEELIQKALYKVKNFSRKEVEEIRSSLV